MLTGMHLARFLARVERTSGCWYWKGAHISQGYGETWDGVRPLLAHRVAYELWVGPIPDGCSIDHTCHNADPTCVGRGAECPHRGCLNPAHLDAVPISTNQLRAFARLPGRSHCKHGHTLDDAYITKRGYRTCRTCRKISNTARIKEPGVGTGRYTRKSHCPQGHPWSEDNTYITRTGARSCRTCKREQARQYRERKAA